MHGNSYQNLTKSTVIIIIRYKCCIFLDSEDPVFSVHLAMFPSCWDTGMDTVEAGVHLLSSLLGPLPSVNTAQEVWVTD